MAVVHDSGFELVDPLPISSGFIPSYCNLFPKKKIRLGENQYRDDDDIIPAVDDFF